MAPAKDNANSSTHVGKNQPIKKVTRNPKSPHNRNKNLGKMSTDAISLFSITRNLDGFVQYPAGFQPLIRVILVLPVDHMSGKPVYCRVDYVIHVGSTSCLVNLLNHVLNTCVAVIPVVCFVYIRSIVSTKLTTCLRNIPHSFI